MTPLGFTIMGIVAFSFAVWAWCWAIFSAFRWLDRKQAMAEIEREEKLWAKRWGGKQ